MNQTITISSKTAEQILARLDALTNEVKTIKAKLFEEEPSYGSDEWWEKEIAEGLKEVKKGKVKKFTNMTEAIRYLNSSELVPTTKDW